LDSLSRAQRAEYGAYKVAEVYLGFICEGMEALEEALAEASLRNEAVAKFVKDKLHGSQVHPAFWKGGAGGDLVKHICVNQLRLQVEREDPEGTWSHMEAKVSELPAMSAFGMKEREEARKLAMKELKSPSSSQDSASTLGAPSVKGAGSSRAKAFRSSGGQGTKEPVCHACGEKGHKAYESACEPGRAWVERKKASGTWREPGEY
jgi:hypothetical protein